MVSKEAKRSFMKRNRVGNIIWHTFVWIITGASIAEVVFGFIPVEEGLGTGIKVFFMGLSLIGFFYEIVSHLFSRFESKNDLSQIIERCLILSKDDRLPDSRILEIESDLDSFFNCTNGEYHIIVISSCVDTNEYPYMKTIWDNINSNVRYLYITPDTDQDFINKLISLFIKKGFSDLSTVYKIVVEKISHISSPRLFDILPREYDLCVYLKDQNNRISNAEWHGFFSSRGIADQDSKLVFYYYPISSELFNRIYSKYSNSFSEERIIQSYQSDKIEIKNSPIDGKGLFCKLGMKIKKGEIVLIKGGHELHRSEMVASKVIDSYLPIGDDLYLGAKTPEEEQQIKIFINHSCNPNLGMYGDRSFIAIRDISEGQELTIDYAFIDNEDYSFDCKCGSRNCRKKVSGYDWKRLEIQKKYSKYFAKYLQEKIKKI